jgi:MATE family multidrug resistance protein
MIFAPETKMEIRALLKLSIPIAIGELSGVIMNLIDALMIGHLGAESVAAVSVANAVFLLFAIVGIGSSLVIAPMVATAFAQNDVVKCRSLWYGGVIFSFMMSILLMICIGCGVWNFEFLGQEPGVTVKAKSFLLYLMPSVFPMIMFLQCKHFADGIAYPRLGMLISIIALGIDAFLNWLLIYGNWGFPELGLNGAAITNTITQLLMMLGIYFLLRYKSNFIIIKSANYDYFKTYFMAAYQIFKEAIPVGFQTVLEYAAFGFGAIMVGWVNAIELAAHQIAINIAMSSFMIILAIGAAGAIRVGQAVGLNDTAKMRLSGRVSLWSGVCFVSLPCLIFIFLPGALAKVFINEPGVIALAIPLIIVAGIFQIADATQSVSQALLRGLGDFKFPSLITFICYWIIGLPAGAYLCFYLHWNALGVWIGFLIALVLQSVLFSVRFFRLVDAWK